MRTLRVVLVLCGLSLASACVAPPPRPGADGGAPLPRPRLLERPHGRPGEGSAPPTWRVPVRLFGAGPASETAREVHA